MGGRESFPSLLVSYTVQYHHMPRPNAVPFGDLLRELLAPHTVPSPSHMLGVSNEWHSFISSGCHGHRGRRNFFAYYVDVVWYRKESVHHPRPNNYRKDRKCRSAKARTIFHSYPADEKCPTGNPCQLSTRTDTYKGAHCITVHHIWLESVSIWPSPPKKPQLTISVHQDPILRSAHVSKVFGNHARWRCRVSPITI